MKVSILGAGPAGSTAAYYLACAGVDVELIDRVSFPRDKCCAGGLFNPLLFDREFPHLREAGGEEVYKAVLSCGKHEASHSSALPLLRTFLRRDLDHFLLKKAQDAGSRFRVGTRPEGDLVIDATGARRALDYPRRGVCMEYDFETGLSLDTIRIDYLFMGIMGYCWLFPKKKHVNIGVGAYLPQKNIREIYSAYLRFLRDRNIFAAPHERFRARIIPFSQSLSQGEGNRMKTGDAAGYVRPGTGEGIFFAMLSGKIAARAIVEGRDRAWYAACCRSTFGVHLKPVQFSWSRRLLSTVMREAVRIGSKDRLFAQMLVEDFFRIQRHSLAPRFLTKLCR